MFVQQVETEMSLLCSMNVHSMFFFKAKVKDDNNCSTFLFKVMLGGEWFESLFGAPDQMDELSLAQVAIQELRNHLGIVRSPAVKISKVHKVRLCVCVCVYV